MEKRYMRHVVFTGANKQPSYVTSSSPLLSKDKLNEGEILLQILCAAICPSDIDRIDGKTEDNPGPSSLGHEGVGEVIFTSSRTSHGDLKPGDHVVFCSPYSCISHNNRLDEPFKNLSCCSCQYNGTEFFGGAFSTHLILGPSVHIEKIPNHIPDEVGALLNCPMAMMVNAVRTLIETIPSQYNNEERSAIILGAGVLGMYGCALLKENGFTKIYVVDGNKFKWPLVQKFGGTPIDSLSDFERSFIPAKNILDTSGEDISGIISILKLGSIYINLVSNSQTTLKVPLDELVKKNITIMGISKYLGRDLKEAVEFLLKTINKYPYHELVSAPFPLSDFCNALSMAQSDKYRRILIRPDPNET